MKRSLASSDSPLPAFMSICPNSTDEHNDEGNNNPMYTREFQSMMMEGLDEEEICVEEVSGKKRRLKADQVKALEKNFEVENKLEPERKVKLAQELGLQPRQVAVWFQNRRARWKTKQLERDYGVLKASYDALKLNYESLQRDNQTLLKEIREIKSKLNGDERKVSVKEEEPLLSETEEKIAKSDTEEDEDEEEATATATATATENNENGLTIGVNPLINFGDHLKDGSSDSDSSAILNDHESPILNIHNGSSSSSSMNITFQFSGSKAPDGTNKNQYSSYQPHQFVKIEEHNFFGHEDQSCSSLFTDDDQAPTLHWYSSDQDWNLIN